MEGPCGGEEEEGKADEKLRKAECRFYCQALHGFSLRLGPCAVRPEKPIMQTGLRI